MRLGRVCAVPICYPFPHVASQVQRAVPTSPTWITAHWRAFGIAIVGLRVGWFLREAWRKRPGPVESFLLKWKDSAPRKIYQYATEKMTKQQKARFRRERKK